MPVAAVDNLKAPDGVSGGLRRRLRASEVVSLKVSDIDSQRMTLRIEQGKGSKRSLRHAVAGPAGTLGALGGICPMHKAKCCRWLAVSGLGPHRPSQGTVNSTGLSMLQPRRRG